MEYKTASSIGKDIFDLPEWDLGKKHYLLLFGYRKWRDASIQQQILFALICQLRLIHQTAGGTECVRPSKFKQCRFKLKQFSISTLTMIIHFKITVIFQITQQNDKFAFWFCNWFASCCQFNNASNFWRLYTTFSDGMHHYWEFYRTLLSSGKRTHFITLVNSMTSKLVVQHQLRVDGVVDDSNEFPKMDYAFINCISHMSTSLKMAPQSFLY